MKNQELNYEDDQQESEQPEKVKKPANASAEDAKNRADTKKAIDKQKKVRIMLPRLPGDQQNHDVEVQINGIKYKVPRGESTEVPEAIAEVLAHARMI